MSTISLPNNQRVRPIVDQNSGLGVTGPRRQELPKVSSANTGAPYVTIWMYLALASRRNQYSSSSDRVQVVQGRKCQNNARFDDVGHVQLLFQDMGTNGLARIALVGGGVEDETHRA